MLVGVCFRRGFYCWVIILNFSSFFIILFAVDLSFPIFVSNMSVAVIFPMSSSMRAGHSSSICSCVFRFIATCSAGWVCVSIMVVAIYVYHPCSGSKYCIAFFPRQ